MMIFWEDLKNLEEVSKVDTKFIYWNCFWVWNKYSNNNDENHKYACHPQKSTNHLPFNQTLALESSWKIHSLSSWVFIMTTLGLNEFLIKQPPIFHLKNFCHFTVNLSSHYSEQNSKQNWPIERLPKAIWFQVLLRLQFEDWDRKLFPRGFLSSLDVD